MVVKTVCDSILSRALALDMHAEVASVSRRDADDSMLVRIRTSKDAALGVIAALRAAWPLATVSLVENRLNGNTEAQVMLPNERDEIAHAKLLANFGVAQKPLRLLANGLLVALAISCVLRVAL